MDIKKSGMIAIVGRPNVGKSTLTNALVGEKIAIVTNKPQTTRSRICAVVNKNGCQYVFLDTPGLHRARTKLGDYMVKVARESVADVDAVLLLVEPIDHIGAPEAELIQQQALAGDSQALTFRQLVNGVPVYSCQLVFTYEGGQLRTIQGAALTGDIQPAQSAGNIQDLPTALIRFLSGVLTSGDVCSAIEDLQLGYRGSQTFGEESVLSPVWLISTNISDYYLDAATGELTRTAG